VLPPELLRTLPEWRALVMRGNLSPVVVRLRMAWRRRDHRRANRVARRRDNRIGVIWQRLMPVPATSRPQPPWPRPGGANGADTLVIGRRSEHPAGPQPQPASPDEPATQRGARGPQPAPTWKSTPDAPRPPLPPGEGLIPRPRRPWDPPADPGNRK